MADKVTLGSVANIDNSLLTTINNNNALTTTAINNTLSRDGTTPNQMLATLDMNNFQIVNLPFPSTINSPARLVDVTTPGSITIVTALTGTSGHTVGFLDGANTWSNTQTFTMPSGLTQGLVVNQTATGSTGANLSLNSVTVGDTVNAGANTVYGISSLININSSTVQGERVGVSGQVQLNSASNAANPNKFYIGIQGVATSFSADGGTNPAASGTSAGEIQGGNFTALAGASATSLFAL